MLDIVRMLARKEPTENARNASSPQMPQARGSVRIAASRLQVPSMGDIVPMLINRPPIENAKRKRFDRRII